MVRIVGFHACERDFAKSIAAGQTPIAEWRPSAKSYDWLGKGIYFWESSKRRAIHWARNWVEGEPALIRAEIELGVCLDLSDCEYLDLFPQVFQSLVELYEEEGWKLPVNRSIEPRHWMQRTLIRFLDGANSIIYPQVTGVRFRRTQPMELRSLDRLVLEQFIDLIENGYGDVSLQYDTVRSPFEEGEPLFRGSTFREWSHVQVAVRNAGMIKSVEVVEVD